MKLTFTLGPASDSGEIISGLLETADRFRLNASHLTPQSLTHWLDRLSALFHIEQTSVPVVIDLQGAKMRIGDFPSVNELPSRVTFALADKSDDISMVPVPHADFFSAVRPGDQLSLNDARIRIEILTTETGESAPTAIGRVLTNGPLSSHKGINRAIHPIPFSKISERDLAMIQASRHCSFVEFAFSFVLTGDEARLLKPLTAGHRLVAKIERPEAMPFLEKIDEQFDELWFCRGDLGAQAGLARLGALQEEFISRFPGLQQPKYLAGQVLEHMTHFPEPTRSEVVHLFDSCKKGFDGIVLSDETAVGKNPLRVAEFLKDFFEAQK